MSRIPKLLHYSFRLSWDFGGKPWSLLHYVCVRSAIEAIRPEQVILYAEYEPHGPWWNLTKSMVTVVPIKAPRTVFDRPLFHPAHRADVVRLKKLIEHGGIYLDADVFVHRSFDDLLHYSTVLGQVGIEGEFGLANAVILAEPKAPFVQRWFDEYQWFRSNGHDQYWGEHSVSVPGQLAKRYPEALHILDYKAFHWPLWTDDHLEWTFASDRPIPMNGTYANHLCESGAWKYVRDLTPRQVRSIDTNFHRWARPLVADLPDDYGVISRREHAAALTQKVMGKARRRILAPAWWAIKAKMHPFAEKR